MSQPDMIVLTATTVDATAGSANGTITAIASGGTGNYTYSIDNGSTWQSSNVFSGLSAGTYIVYVSDSNGCTVWYTVIVNDASNCTMTITANVIPGSGCAASCSDEIVYTYTNSGGTAPYLITLTNQNGNTWTQTQTTANGTGNFTGLCAGVYIVTVQDANGCEAVYTIQIVGYGNMTINVSTIDPTIGMADGAIDVVVAGGLPTYQYSIDNQVNWTATPTFTNLPAGVYLVYTKDQNECTQVTSAKLGQSTATLNELSNDVAVYPNPTRDRVIIEGSGIQSLELHGIDRAKLPVLPSEMTNGYYMDLSALSAGVYVIVLHFEHGSENVRVVKE